MERLSIYISDRMVLKGIISESDKPDYCYSVQLLLEKTAGLTLILISAACFHMLVQIIAFLVVFISIRRFSDGFHCQTTAGCLCASVLMCLSTGITAPLMTSSSAMCIGTIVVSMAVIFAIATFNDPDMELTIEELSHLKKRSRITVLITGGLIMIIELIFPGEEIVSYMALGVIYNALSILISILKGRRNQSDDYEEI